MEAFPTLPTRQQSLMAVGLSDLTSAFNAWLVQRQEEGKVGVVTKEDVEEFMARFKASKAAEAGAGGGGGGGGGAAR